MTEPESGGARREGYLVRRRLVVGLGVLAVVTAALAGCTRTGSKAHEPTLEPRDTTMTRVKPTRQDLTNRLSLSGKVAMNPVFGIVAPVAGQVRYVTVPSPSGTPTKATR